MIPKREYHGLSTPLTGEEAAFWTRCQRVAAYARNHVFEYLGFERPVDDPSLVFPSPFDPEFSHWFRMPFIPACFIRLKSIDRSLRFISIDSSLKSSSFWVFTRPLVICEFCFPSPLNELTTGLHSSPEPESKTKWEAWKKILVVQKLFLGYYPSLSLAKGSVHGWSIEDER